MSTMKDMDKAKQVAAVYMTLSGNPYIYYGEELGMLGAKPDEMLRTPFLWGNESSETATWIEDVQNGDTPTLKEQMADKNSMYSFYKNIIAVRKSHTALTQGDYKAVDLKNDSVMSYIRESEDERILVIHNFSSNAQALDLQEYEIKEVVFATDKKMCGEDVVESTIQLGSNDSVLLLLGM